MTLDSNQCTSLKFELTDVRQTARLLGLLTSSVHVVVILCRLIVNILVIIPKLNNIKIIRKMHAFK